MTNVATPKNSIGNFLAGFAYKLTAPARIYQSEPFAGETKPNRTLFIRLTKELFEQLPAEMFAVKVSQGKKTAGQMVYKFLSYRFDATAQSYSSVCPFPGVTVQTDLNEIKGQTIATMNASANYPEISLVIKLNGPFKNVVLGENPYDKTTPRVPLFDNNNPDYANENLRLHGNPNYYLKGDVPINIHLKGDYKMNNAYFMVDFSYIGHPSEFLVYKTEAVEWDGSGPESGQFGSIGSQPVFNPTDGNNGNLTW